MKNETRHFEKLAQLSQQVLVHFSLASLKKKTKPSCDSCAKADQGSMNFRQSR
jgi:hypothetical protein